MRSLKGARKAYKSRDVNAMIKAHRLKTPFEGHHHLSIGRYLKSAVYGGMDGIITTFAVVAGVVGASLSSGIILIMGFANLIADGISMAIGDYLSTKAEREFYKTERSREKWEVDNYIQGEKNEMIELYMKRGLSENDARKMVSLISKKKDFFIDQMMIEELNMVDIKENSPERNAIVTFISFLLFGLIPLSIYLFDYIFKINNINALAATSVLAGAALFVLGIAKSRITHRNWLISGVETVLIGGIAAAAAYLVGYFVSLLI